MKRLAGQAGRTLVTIFHQTGAFIMAVILIAILAAGALAYRLSLGPLEIPWAAARLANAASGTDAQIHIGTAELAWAGYKKGGHAPLYLQLGDIVVNSAGGAPLASIPQAQLVFSLGALFADRAPIYVSGENAHVAGSDAPVSLLAGIRLGAAFRLASADLWITIGPGRLGAPGFDEPISAGRFQLSITPTDLRLSDGSLTLAPYGQSAPVLHIAGDLRQNGPWQGAVTLNAAAVQAADLPHYWPMQLIPMTRGWVTQNITAGTARDAAFTLGLAAPPNLASLRIASATGSFLADNGTLIWLTGVLPLTGLGGKFTLTDVDDIDITADTGHLGGIALTDAHMHIAGVSHPGQVATLTIPVSGSVADTFAVLNGPNLGLLKTIPPPVRAATGNVQGVVHVTLPLQQVDTANEVKLEVETQLSDVTLPLPVQGLTLHQGALNVNATLHGLTIVGDAQLSGAPASLAANANFATSAVTFDMKTTANAATLRDIGWNPGSFITGPLPVTVHAVTNATSGSLTVTADLTQAAMVLPVFGWTKPAGATGRLSLGAQIGGDTLSGITRLDSFAATAPGLNVSATVDDRAIDFGHAQIGSTQASGRIEPPASGGQPWRIIFTGNALDLSSIVNPLHKNVTETPPMQPAAKTAPLTPHRQLPPSGFLWQASVHFDRLLLTQSPKPALQDFSFDGSGQGNFIFQASAAAQMDAGQLVTLNVTPAPTGALGDAHTLRLQTGDAGQLLRVLGKFYDLQGGNLDLTAKYGANAPLRGLTRITHFRLLNAPALGKFLQAITVLGIPEAASGPGLSFDRLVMPFSLENQVLTLNQARAYSASLGLTASGTIDLDASLYDIHGTVVPAYALNALPGKIPLIGKLFSPEKGGGLFAMRFSLTGPIANPKVEINPLSALTPGFLRGIFALGSKPVTKQSIFLEKN